jgi:hypothetical protein
LRRKERAATRGSPRSFAAPKTLAQDDDQNAWFVPLLSHRQLQKKPASCEAGVQFFRIKSEAEARAELILARGIHIVYDLSKV